MNSDNATTEDDKRAVAREDFIKRLFAVTLSVGIANQLSKTVSSSIVNHQLHWNTVLLQWRGLLLLTTSLFIVVTSWEGYHGAIKRLPLKDAGRFWVDIALVFSYLMLTLSSDAYDLWFSIHMFIFFEYLLWDILRARLPEYKDSLKSCPRKKHQLSMTITIVWLIYFIGIFALKANEAYFQTTIGFVAISAAALAGVLLYRRDKTYRWNWTTKLLASIVPLGCLLFLAYIRAGG